MNPENTGVPIEDKQIVAEALDVLIAGADTVGSIPTMRASFVDFLICRLGIHWPAQPFISPSSILKLGSDLWTSCLPLFPSMRMWALPASKISNNSPTYLLASEKVFEWPMPEMVCYLVSCE